jgi:hypothetical protein
MPLTKKGKKIKKSFKKQYGKDADKVFYASANKGTLKGVIKKSKGGGFDYEGDAYGTTPSASFSQVDTGDLGSESANVSANRKATGQGDTPAPNKNISSSTSAINLVGKAIFDVTGMGYALETVKNIGKNIKNQQKLTQQKKVDVLGGEMLTTKGMRRPYAPPPISDNGGSDPIQPILKKPIGTAKKAVETFDASKFFPFKAYKSGGVRFGPPPKRGPNPIVPPVKMKTGGKGTCPHRPDGIKGVGKAIKGFKFIGVK